MAKDMAVAIDVYLKLRTKKEEIEKAAKEQIAEIVKKQSYLESKLLETMNEEGIESIKAETGTIYKRTLTHVNVSDFNDMLSFIKSNEAYDLLEKRVSKNAALAYIENGNDIPGIKVTQELKLSVRR